MNKNHNITKWLNTSQRNKDMVSPYESVYTMDAYYFDKEKNKDIDLINYKGNNENDPHSDHIYIDPATNRYHANMLFRMLIDYSYENEFDYVLHDPETKEPYLKFNLMDRSLKSSFYKFCFENS